MLVCDLSGKPYRLNWDSYDVRPVCGLSAYGKVAAAPLRYEGTQKKVFYWKFE